MSELEWRASEPLQITPRHHLSRALPAGRHRMGIHPQRQARIGVPRCSASALTFSPASNRTEARSAEAAGAPASPGPGDHSGLFHPAELIRHGRGARQADALTDLADRGALPMLGDPLRDAPQDAQLPLGEVIDHECPPLPVRGPGGAAPPGRPVTGPARCPRTGARRGRRTAGAGGDAGPCRGPGGRQAPRRCGFSRAGPAPGRAGKRCGPCS
jgi:hypothetical protein